MHLTLTSDRLKFSYRGRSLYAAGSSEDKANIYWQRKEGFAFVHIASIQYPKSPFYSSNLSNMMSLIFLSIIRYSVRKFERYHME